MFRTDTGDTGAAKNEDYDVDFSSGIVLMLPKSPPPPPTVFTWYIIQKLIHRALVGLMENTQD